MEHRRRLRQEGIMRYHLGADFIVVGRAITESADPRAAADRLLEEINAD